MKSQINIGRLLDQEFIDRDDELLCDLLKADSNGRTPRSLNQKNLMKLFRLSNFRAEFAKKQLIKKNHIQFVWPKYVVSDVYRGRSQLISPLAFDDDESFIEKLSFYLIKEYLMIYCVVYQNDDPLFANNFLKLQTLSQVEVYVDNYFPRDKYNYILLDEFKMFINLSHFNFNIVSLNNYPNIKFIDKKTIIPSHNFFPIKKEFVFISSNFINCKEFYSYVNDNYDKLNWDLNFLFKLPNWFKYDLINKLKERINPDKIRNLNLFELVRSHSPIDLIEYSMSLGNSWEISQVSALINNKGSHVPRLKLYRLIRTNGQCNKDLYKKLESNMELIIDRAVREVKYSLTKIIVNEKNILYIKELKERCLLQNSGKTFFDKYLLTSSQFFGTDKWFSLSEHLIKKVLDKDNA